MIIVQLPVWESNCCQFSQNYWQGSIGIVCLRLCRAQRLLWVFNVFSSFL